jgi:peptidyl-prolyl cis-trans isomerase C
MSLRTKLFPALALVAAATFSQPATAQDNPDIDTVLATVNGTDITLGHMIALRASLPAQYGQLPAEILFTGILDQLIQQTLLMQSFEGDISKRSELVLENERRAILATEAIENVMQGDLDDATVQAAYDERYASAAQDTEYKAAHILVETEETARDLIAQLDGGADFAALAREHSTGPSGPNGGDLGWFGPGVMVESFFNAVASLLPGEISEPVQTQFGWHVIKLNETRLTETPPLDEVRAEIEETLRQEKFDAHVETLSGNATITRNDASGIAPETINNLELLEN